MPSQIVPSLLAALQSATFGYSADDALLLGAADPAQQQQTPVFALYPDSVRAGLSNDALASSDGSWASHFVPTVNLFLALVVFLFLVEERSVILPRIASFPALPVARSSRSTL